MIPQKQQRNKTGPKKKKKEKKRQTQGSGTHFDAKSEDCDHSLEDESQGQFPQCSVDTCAGQCAGLEWVRSREVTFVVAANNIHLSSQLGYA